MISDFKNLNYCESQLLFCDFCAIALRQSCKFAWLPYICLATAVQILRLLFPLPSCEHRATREIVLYLRTADLQCHSLRSNRTCLDICKNLYDLSTALSTYEIVRPNSHLNISFSYSWSSTMVYPWSSLVSLSILKTLLTTLTP